MAGRHLAAITERKSPLVVARFVLGIVGLWREDDQSMLCLLYDTNDSGFDDLELYPCSFSLIQSTKLSGAIPLGVAQNITYVTSFVRIPTLMKPLQS